MTSFPYSITVDRGHTHDPAQNQQRWAWLYENIGPVYEEWEWEWVPSEQGFEYRFKTPEHATLFTLTWL